MRTCPKCNELNGDNRTTCFKCNTSLGAVDRYKKVCPKCSSIFSPKVDVCPHCHIRLNVLGELSGASRGSGSNEQGVGLYVASFLFPLLGFILGCIYIAKGDDRYGKNLILAGVASVVIYTLLIFTLF